MTSSAYNLRKLRYRQHKQNARKRIVPWYFNYATWWRMWAESGKWDRRGPFRGQSVMARLGDSGPYSPTNVKICSVTENHTKKEPVILSNTARKKISQANMGNKHALGQERSSKTREKIRQARLGTTHSDKTKEKLSRLNEKHWKDPAYSAIMRLAAKKLWLNNEFRAKMIGNKYGVGNKSRTGKPHSVATKLKMSKARKAWWRRKYR